MQILSIARVVAVAVRKLTGGQQQYNNAMIFNWPFLSISHDGGMMKYSLRHSSNKAVKRCDRSFGPQWVVTQVQNHGVAPGHSPAYISYWKTSESIKTHVRLHN